MKTMTLFFLFIFVTSINLVEASDYPISLKLRYCPSFIGDKRCHYHTLPVPAKGTAAYEENVNKFDRNEFVDFSEYIDIQGSNLSGCRIIGAFRNVIITEDKKINFRRTEEEMKYFFEKNGKRDVVAYSTAQEALDAFIEHMKIGA